ncbi:MAG: hypothetical protein ACREPB_08460 [Arenimonas sp.]
MNTYLFGNQILQSSLDLKELPRLSGAVILSAIRIELVAVCQPENHHWLHEWKESDDTVTIGIASHPDGYLLRFPELCDFILDPCQRIIQAIPHDELDAYTIEHLLVDQVLPRFLANENHLLLHACAVNIMGRTVLFLGKSGWGKSTLAALFHKNGFKLYSDDCVLLEPNGPQWQAIATYPSLRLYDDSIESIFIDDSSLSPVSEYSDKQRMALTIDREQVVPPLHAMYFLSDPETVTGDISIENMRPANTCIEIIERSFRLDLDNRAQSRQLMTSTAALTQSVPAYRLSYPHNFENNARLLARLLQHIQQ